LQVLSKVSRVLLDKDLRSIYDTEGEVDDDCGFNEKNIKDWSQYWKNMFHVRPLYFYYTQLLFLISN